MSRWNRIAEQTSHRPWTLPEAAWIATMSWTNLLFAHWEVDPGAVQTRLPAGLVVDQYDGRAFVGVVPFRMERVGPRGCGGLPPRFPGPRSFPELNVRTYVECPATGKPGVWFFSLDASSRLAVEVARRAFFLPYVKAEIRVTRDGDWIDYDCRRADRRMAAGRFQARYRGIGDRLEAAPGSLESWLTERYCLYSVDESGQVWCCDVHHCRWSLRRARAEILENTIAAAHGFDLGASPLLLVAKPIDVIAWMRTPVARNG